LTNKVRQDVIVVKFQEGTRIRMLAGVLQADPATSPRDAALLSRANLTRQSVFGQLAEVQRLIGDGTKYAIRPLFRKAEADLDREKQVGEQATGEELADLNLYYEIRIANSDRRQTEALIDRLNALAVVEIAYPRPIPEPAQADIPPESPSFVNEQGYLDAAPAGINARYAWLFPGGKGTDVRIIDVEQGWNFQHEDLPAVFYRSGIVKGEFQLTYRVDVSNLRSFVIGRVAASLF
jgi:hypothetical protein